MNWREITKEQFFATVGKLNVHPRPEPMESLWVDQNSMRVRGRTTPGYLCQPLNAPTRFYIPETKET